MKLFILMTFISISKLMLCQTICNSGFEIPKNSFYPDNLSQLDSTSCWVDKIQVVNNHKYHSPDWHHLAGPAYIMEDLNNTGNYIPIQGNFNSQGYVGFLECEMVQQGLTQPLQKNEKYALSFFIRIPAPQNLAFPDTGYVFETNTRVVDIVVYLSKNQPIYVYPEKFCSDGQYCYELDYQGDHMILDTISLNISNYPPGSWYRYISKPFIPDNNYNWISFQSTIRPEHANCKSYLLIDDFEIVKEGCTENDCETCEYGDGPIQVNPSSHHTTAYPLTLNGTENLVHASVSIFAANGALASIYYSENCLNGFTKNAIEIDANNLANGYYPYQLIYANKCGVCMEEKVLIKNANYGGIIDTACACRSLGIERECCKNLMVPEQYHTVCNADTFKYVSILDIVVNQANTFTVLNGDYVEMRAGNSITLDAGFETESGGSFLAEVAVCEEGFNKRGAHDYQSKSIEKSSNTEILSDRFICYPNPTNSFITIQCHTENGAVVKVFSSQGLLLSSFTLEPNKAFNYNMSHLAKGLYLFEFRSDGERQTKRILLE